ncbi:MAG: RNA polymerase sigma factor, partial [Conexibacter sp.]
MDQRGDRGQQAEERALRLVQDHAASLLRFARRFSLCADDAQDAYQRGAEILVRRMRTEPPQEPLSWLRTVIRHEALAVRAERERIVGRDEVDLDRHEAHDLVDPADRAAGFERLGHVAEALGRLKPQEVTALVLRAEGLSYKEICARQGWTYTKCNRAVTEGRRALLDRLGAIESGAECERWLPLLSALADGEASGHELA